MDAEAIYLDDLKRRKPEHRRELWSLTPMAHCNLLKEPLQALYLKNAVIFFPEFQRWYPAGSYEIDEIMQHIISTHRHDRNVIHWDSQAWEYVHHFIRYETSKVWKYEAIHRNELTGESNWFGTGLKRHKRMLYDAVDVQLKHRSASCIIKTQKFFINAKGIARYNSYDSMEVIRRKDISEKTIADIIDPRTAYLLPSAEPSPDLLSEPVEQNNALSGQPEPSDDHDLIPGKNPANKTDACGKVSDPKAHARRKSPSKRKDRQKKRSDGVENSVDQEGEDHIS